MPAPDRPTSPSPQQCLGAATAGAQAPAAHPDATLTLADGLTVGQAVSAVFHDPLAPGTPVLAWPITRHGSPLVTRTRGEVWALGDGTRVVAVEGRAGGIALTHVDVLPTVAGDAPCGHCGRMLSEPVENPGRAAYHDYCAGVVYGEKEFHGRGPGLTTGVELHCDDCQQPYGVWFAENPVWNLVMGGPEAKGDPGGMLCPRCFTVRAESVYEQTAIWRLVLDNAARLTPHDQLTPGQVVADMLMPEDDCTCDTPPDEGRA